MAGEFAVKLANTYSYKKRHKIIAKDQLLAANLFPDFSGKKLAIFFKTKEVK
jgi:hypothetical protein